MRRKRRSTASKDEVRKMVARKTREIAKQRKTAKDAGKCS